MKILMLINLKSGMKNSKQSLLDALDVFSSYNHEVTTYITQKKNDAYNYLINCRKKYDLVCVAGGDGTLNEVSNALMRKRNRPLLGYFPSGTMNDFASNFNLSKDFKEIAKRICKNKVHYFDVGQFNDLYFNYVCAFGSMCDVPFTTDRNTKEVIGSAAYIIEGISKLGEVKKNHIKYTINNKTYESDILLGLVYSGNRVAGVELEDKSSARVDDGYFNVLIVDYVPSIFETPDLISTIMQKDKFIHSYKCSEILIETDKKLICTIDGEEAFIKDKAKIKINKKALRLLA